MGVIAIGMFVSFCVYLDQRQPKSYVQWDRDYISTLQMKSNKDMAALLSWSYGFTLTMFSRTRNSRAIAVLERHYVCLE